MNSKKILIYLGRHASKRSGMWRYAEILCEALINELKERGKADWELRVSFGGPEDIAGNLKRRNLGLEIVNLNCNLRSRRFGLISDLFQSTRNACLVHGMANLVPFAPGTVKVLTLHDLLQAYHPDGAWSVYKFFKGAFYKILLRIQYLISDCVLVDSEFAKDDLLKQFRSATKVQVLYPPLSADYLSAPEPKEIRKDGYFLTFASLDPRKNIKALLRAFSRWPSRKDVKLKIILASCVFRAEFEALVKELELSDLVEFLEDVPSATMPELYASARGLFFPSLGEGFGYPIYEALSQGVPVLCSSELIIEALKSVVLKAVINCNCSNEDDLLRGIEELANLELSVQDRQAIARSARSELDPRRAALRLIEIYKACLEKA